MLNSVGGVGALLPLLEQVCGAEQAEAAGQETSDLLGPELTSSRGPAGMLLPLGKSSGQHERTNNHIRSTAKLSPTRPDTHTV